MSIPSLLIQRRLCQLRNVYSMVPQHLPREALSRELRDGARRVSRRLLRFKDTIKRDLKEASINTTTGRTPLSTVNLAADCQGWSIKSRGRLQIPGHFDESGAKAARALRTVPASVQTAWGTDTPGTGFAATQDPAPPALRANHRLFEARMPKCYPNVDSYGDLDLKQICKLQEKLKKRLDMQIVMDLERGTFTPLVFTTTMEWEKKGEDYATTVSWICSKVSFVILGSALLCLRGSRTVHRTIKGNVEEADFDLDR